MCDIIRDLLILFIVLEGNDELDRPLRNWNFNKQVEYKVPIGYRLIPHSLSLIFEK
jgi:hypothetical protein